jgi:hypothetical protein
VPQNQALESEIEELQDKIKGVENPIKENYKKQIKDITEKYNSSIKEYNRRLSVIQEKFNRNITEDEYKNRDQDRKKKKELFETTQFKLEQQIRDQKAIEPPNRLKQESNRQKELNKLGLPSNATQVEIDLRVSELDENEFRKLQGTNDSVLWNIEYENYSRVNLEIKEYFIYNYGWHLGISPRPSSDKREEILFKYFITQKVFQEHRKHKYSKSIELEINRRIEMRNNLIKIIESERNIQNQGEARQRQQVTANATFEAAEAAKRDDEYKALYAERKEREREIDKARDESENREYSTIGKLSSYLFGKR